MQVRSFHSRCCRGMLRKPAQKPAQPLAHLQVLSLTDSAHFKTLLAETHANNELLVVDYLTTWCGPCKMVAPQVEQLAQDLEHKGLRVAKFTCDASDANKKCEAMHKAACHADRLLQSALFAADTGCWLTDAYRGDDTTNQVAAHLPRLPRWG